MELFEITITYEDVRAKKEWDRLAKVNSRNTPEPPERKRATTYVAVHIEPPGPIVDKVSKIAFTKIVGEEPVWDEYMPLVEQLTHIGMVWVEESEEENV